MVRSLSRQQQALSLSSCEAELYGLQSVCQESVAFGRLVHRLLFALHEIDEPEEVVIWLESDSSSALQLVRSMDVPRRSRHIEIRLHWLREQMREGLLKLRHRSGVENPADLFTKCLSAKAFFKHRYALGIVVPDGLTAELAELRELCVLQQVLTQGSSIAIVELCCSEHSNLRKVCEVSNGPIHWCSCQGAEFWNIESCSCLHPTVEELFMSALGAYSCIDSLWKWKSASQF